MTKRVPNPSGKGGFRPGISGNPAGRSRLAIANLGAEARKYSTLALETVVAICKGELKGVTPRDRLAAANVLLDRGHGKPSQAIDLIMLGKRIAELSDAELVELQARLATTSGRPSNWRPRRFIE